MTNSLINEVIPLLTLSALMGVILLALNFWSRHYSRNAKALGKRLGDIVNMRSSLADSQLIKDSGTIESRVMPGTRVSIATQMNEATKLMLLRAGAEMTASKLFAISLSLLMASLLLLTLLTEMRWWLMLVVSLLCAGLPFIHILRLEAKRAKKIEKQLPEALDFICRSLRAGHGLSVSFGLVGDELAQPIAKEFKTVFEEINFGLPFDEALSNFAVRTDSNDINFLVVGLLIQREAGGNLIELLENLSKTIRDRMILRGKIRVLASEGKYSGILLSVLPFILGSILSVMNPDYMSLLWTSETGQQLVLVSVLMIALGGFWMWNISRIKV
jgi:tight adherence protein B